MRLILNLGFRSYRTRGLRENLVGGPWQRGIPATLVGMALTIASCADVAPTKDPDQVSVVATTSILGDVVRNMVGNDAAVEVIMGPGSDPHDFQASAQQARVIKEADLVVAVGGGLEEDLTDVILAAAEDGTVVLELIDKVNPIPFAATSDPDPHFWQDPARMAVAVDAIADSLTAIAPQVDWSSKAAEYATELIALDTQIEQQLAPIAGPRRKIVTNHDSFGYFADRYGFELIGTVVPGGSTLAEPSASDLADLVAAIRAAGVVAIFAENTNPDLLAEAVASEVGTSLEVYELYSDSLGEPGSGAETYLGMIGANAETVAEALA